MKLVCVIQVSPSAFHGGLTNRVSKDAPSMVLDSRDLTTRGHIPPSRLFIPVQYIFHCMAIPMIFPLYSHDIPTKPPFFPSFHPIESPSQQTWGADAGSRKLGVHSEEDCNQTACGFNDSILSKKTKHGRKLK